VAQDFHADFHGTDDKHIAPFEEGGVACAAIKGSNQKVENRAHKLEEQLPIKDAEIVELQRAVAELRAARRENSPPTN
jgi:hypothetical protein